MNVPVKLYEGSYENIKITTPEDLEIIRELLAEHTCKSCVRLIRVHTRL